MGTLLEAIAVDSDRTKYSTTPVCLTGYHQVDRPLRQPDSVADMKRPAEAPHVEDMLRGDLRPVRGAMRANVDAGAIPSSPFPSSAFDVQFAPLPYGFHGLPSGISPDHFPSVFGGTENGGHLLPVGSPASAKTEEREALVKVCRNCQTTNASLWRDQPLCYACGLLYVGTQRMAGCFPCF